MNGIDELGIDGVMRVGGGIGVGEHECVRTVDEKMAVRAYLERGYAVCLGNLDCNNGRLDLRVVVRLSPSQTRTDIPFTTSTYSSQKLRFAVRM